MSEETPIGEAEAAADAGTKVETSTIPAGTEVAPASEAAIQPDLVLASDAAGVPEHVAATEAAGVAVTASAIADQPVVGAQPNASLHVSILVLGTIAVLLAVAGAVLRFGPVAVTIDGSRTWITPGTTVADVAKQGRLAGTPGDLLSVDGGVLRRGGGDAPVVRIDGSDAASATTIPSGARLTSGHGHDRVEPTKTRTLETTPTMRFVGTGPVQSVEESGTPGRIEVVAGAVSGREVSRRVVSPGTPMTVRRERAWPGPKEVALTFDDGPWPVSTEAVLATLKAAEAKATFFELGSQVKGRPRLAAEVLAAGMEIGNHSYSHKLLARADHKTITTEIEWGANAIQAAVGVRPVWYRPAGGSTNAFVYKEAKRLGLRVVLWTIDPHDYLKPGARVIAHRVLNNVRPGSVVLMHDGGGNRTQTIAALGLITKGLKARGYGMVTLSRLYRLPGTP